MRGSNGVTEKVAPERQPLRKKQRPMLSDTQLSAGQATASFAKGEHGGSSILGTLKKRKKLQVVLLIHDFYTRCLEDLGELCRIHVLPWSKTQQESEPVVPFHPSY